MGNGDWEFSDVDSEWTALDDGTPVRVIDNVRVVTAGPVLDPPWPDGPVSPPLGG